MCTVHGYWALNLMFIRENYNILSNTLRNFDSNQWKPNDLIVYNIPRLYKQYFDIIDNGFVNKFSPKSCTLQ